MKKVFLDTNVFIDYVAHREVFYEPAATIVSLADKGLFRLLVSSLSFATGSYVLEKHYKKTQKEILNSYRQFLTICGVTAVDESTVKKAIASSLTDFEDAMQYHTAMAAKADCIVTRDKKHFLSSDVLVMDSQEFLNMLSN